MWTFLKNIIYFLVGLALVPLGWYVVAGASNALLGELRPGWEYNWAQFSPNAKLLMAAAVDIAFAVAAVKLLWTGRKFISIGVLCSVVIDFTILITK